MSPVPLADVFAVGDADGGRIQALRRQLADSGAFDRVWIPMRGWLAAARYLPGTAPDPEAVLGAGLLFAEGRQLFCAGEPGGWPRRLDELSDMIRSRPETLDRLPGDFGLLHFDPEGRVSAVRACGGRVPFYFWRTGRRTAVATRLGDLLRFAGVTPEIDPLTCAVLASGWAGCPDNRSPVKDVTLLPRASVTRIDSRGEITPRRFWNPRPQSLPRPTEARRRAHAERLRQHLLACLDRELDPRGGNLLTLSGGVDSSSLAALAAGGLGRELRVWSLLPPPGPDRDREQGFIAPLLDRLHIQHRWTTQLDRDTRIDLLAQAPAVAFPVMHPALCSLPDLHRQAPIRVLFGGEFADAVCGSQSSFPDWAAHTSPWQLLAAPGAWPRGLRTPRRWLRLRQDDARGNPPVPFPARLAGFVTSAVREEYREWLDRRLRATARDRLPLRYLALHCELDAFTAMNWEACSALGIRRVFPFFHREILEWAFDCHPREQLGAETKQLLRQALADDVPARNLQRADKGHWRLGYDTLLRPLRRPLPAPLHTVIDPAWFDAHRDGLGESDELGIEMLRVFQARLEHSRRPDSANTGQVADKQ